MSAQRLKQAITAVQAGNRQEAQEILLTLVWEDPQNEMAWLWLSDVVETVEDRIIALENAIAINPQRVQTRKRLAQIRQSAPVSDNGTAPDANLEEDGRRQEAYHNLLEQVRHAPDDATAWFALSQITDRVEDQIIFLQRTVKHNPNHRQARIRLTQLQLAHQDLLSLAKAHEAQNDIPGAARVYQATISHKQNSADEVIARKRLKQMGTLKRVRHSNPTFIPPATPISNYALAKGRHAEETGEWNEAIAAYTLVANHAATAVTRALAQNRLETAVRQQKLPAVQLTSATTTLWRLGLGPVMLYSLLLLLHGGLNPLQGPFLLWVGGISVLLGSLTLVAVMIIPHHTLAQKLVGNNGRADQLTRILFQTLGVLLILIPFLLLLQNALQRLAQYAPAIPRFY